MNSSIATIKYSVNRPTAVNSSPKHAFLKSKSRFPLIDVKRNPFVGYLFILSCVVILLCASCPSAVILGISLFIINAIYAHSFWRISHVAVKRHKIVSPFIAHSDSTSAIIFVANIVSVLASGYNGTPDHVYVGSRHSMSSMTRLSRASTRFRSTRPERLRSDYRFFSAIAPAKPASILSAGIPRRSDDCPPAESLTGYFDDFHV